MAGSRTSGKYESLKTRPQHNEASQPYDEISHEIDNNFLSIRVLKDIGQIQAVHGNGNEFGTVPSNSIRVNCADASGKTCREECAKINVIPNKQPPEKKPEEESFFLRSKKSISHSDEMHHSLEIEFKAPRNYRPLPEPGPPPPIITVVSKAKTKGAKGGKGKKKKK